MIKNIITYNMRNNKIFISLVLMLSVLFSCSEVPAPEPIYPIPNAAQIEWQKMETYAFIHFGLNTFSNQEWGYGNTPASIFNPDSIDCEQWVRTLKYSGMKGVILTAKHHDGFCLWPTNTTDYNISHSPYKGGKGDLVLELSEACKKYGLKFGLYLSPWDRNNSEYGKEAYQAIYHQQLDELISNYGSLFEFWFDGANGGTGWYGGADESRSIDPLKYYGYELAREKIKRLHPDAMIFGGTVPDVRWVGNEAGWAGETNWSSFNQGVPLGTFPYGMKNGTEWQAAEYDVSIRPGWFYHPEEDMMVKSVAELTDLYYKSVGRNATFLLNFPVSPDGRIHPKDSTNAVNWFQSIMSEFSCNILGNIAPTVESCRGRGYEAKNITDGDWNTYWSIHDDESSGTVVFNFEEPQKMNRLMLQEYIPLGQRVEKFEIEYFDNNNWEHVNTSDSLTTIGYKRIVRFKTIETKALKIRFTKAKGPLCINNIEAYCSYSVPDAPIIRRNYEGMISIKTIDEKSEIFYTVDGSIPDSSSKRYLGPFHATERVTIRAVAFDPIQNLISEESSAYFDIYPDKYRCNLENIGNNVSSMFDGDPKTAFKLQNTDRIIINFPDKYKITGLTYAPVQDFMTGGYVFKYLILIDGSKVASGEFSNISNNPIPRFVSIPSVVGKKLEFVVLNTADKRPASIAELSVRTMIP